MLRKATGVALHISRDREVVNLSRERNNKRSCKRGDRTGKGTQCRTGIMSSHFTTMKK